MINDVPVSLHDMEQIIIRGWTKISLCWAINPSRNYYRAKHNCNTNSSLWMHITQVTIEWIDIFQVVIIIQQWQGKKYPFPKYNIVIHHSLVIITIITREFNHAYKKNFDYCSILYIALCGNTLFYISQLFYEYSSPSSSVFLFLCVSPSSSISHQL